VTEPATSETATPVLDDLNSNRMLSMACVRMLSVLNAEIAAINPSTEERKDAIAIVSDTLLSFARGMDSKYEEFLHETSKRVSGLPHNRRETLPGLHAAFAEEDYYVRVVLPNKDIAYPYMGPDAATALAVYETQMLRVASGVLREARMVAPGRILRFGVRRFHGIGEKPKEPKPKASRKTARR
jgi:hypothetical protein